MTNGLPLPAPNDRILEKARLKIALARQYLESLGEFGLTADLGWVVGEGFGA